MRLSEIYTLVETGQLLSGSDALATLIAIEFLAKQQGVQIASLDFSAPGFARAYPKKTPTLRIGALTYSSWRDRILDAQLLASPGDVEGDPWKTLRRVQRLGQDKRADDLMQLRRFLPEGVLPRAATAQMIRTAYAQLSGHQITNFRSGFRALCQLFSSDLAEHTGLLPEECPSRFAQALDKSRPAMSPEIRTLMAQASDTGQRRAIRFINQLGLSAGLLNGACDTLEDLRRVNGQAARLPRMAKGDVMAKTRLKHVCATARLLGGRDYRLTEAEQAWRDLSIAARAQACAASGLAILGKPATAANILPTQITLSNALSLIASYPSYGMKAHCRRGCREFDALFGKLSPQLLPEQPIGLPVKVARPKAKKPKLTRVERAWKDLTESLRKQASLSKDFSGLWLLRTEAIKAGLKPNQITQAWLEQVRDSCNPRHLYFLYQSVHQIRSIAGLNLGHLKPPRKRRDRHGGLPAAFVQALEVLMDNMGLADNSRRPMRLAVGVALECAENAPIETLDDLIHLEGDAICWNVPSAQIKQHAQHLASLRHFASLPWTADWRELQRVVVASGMSALHNPVPKVLSWEPRTEPHALSAKWAATLNRRLRSTKLNPPHGRADLALTLERHLMRFDALHDIPEVARSGLLPPVIGKYRVSVAS